MKQPPSSPQSYRIRYRDGRVETIEARTCVQVGDDHVFYSDLVGAVLRVPTDTVLAVEPSNVRSKRPRWRKA